VVIHNPGLARELTGWKLAAGDGELAFEFPAGFVLMPDSTIRVHSGPDAKSATPADLVWTDDFVWRDLDGDASLLDVEGNAVSTFSREAA
jgi:hypothetical protein